MTASLEWKYLAPKPRSAYKQLFVKDRWIAATTLYGQARGEGARTPEVLAKDYDLPLEAVLEAIAYCDSNPPEIREDWEREESIIRSAAPCSTNGPGNIQIPDSTPINDGVKQS